MLSYILIAVWLMLPAYVANATAVLCGGGEPVDRGKTMQDGRRVLGDGKTYRGLFGGIFAGTITGIAQIEIIIHIPYVVPSALTLSMFPVYVPLLMATGAMLGDMGASFLKRRAGFERGKMFPVLDQLDFVAGAFILTYPVASDWFVESFTPQILLTVIIITPILHVFSNIVGYLIGKKKVPW
ncbi:MAG: CDP-2,3-bis-(O-geranylgeranyl)-sn-glycerol synthase [Methermicoccaceae archaeon]